MATPEIPAGKVSFAQSDFRGGCNSGDMPFRLQQDQYVWGENVVNRGGILQTRMGYTPVGPELPEGNLQGVTTFRPTGSNTTLLIAAVAGKIYTTKQTNGGWEPWFELPGIQLYQNASRVLWCVGTKSVTRNPDGSLTRIPSRKILIMQDGGFTKAAMFDGSVSRHLFPDPARRETPIGGAMAWIGDRLWVTQGQNLIASDIGDPISFYENVSLAVGGSLTFPDTIVALAPNTDLKNLFVWTANSTHIVQAGIRDRSTWSTTPDFVNDILPGIGCLAPKSVTLQYGLIWWWSNLGLVNQNTALAAYRNSSFIFQDRSMARSKANLSPLVDGICAGRFENYMLFSVPSGDSENAHTWVMDQSVGLVLEGPDANRWNGIWTGIRPVEWTTGIFDTHERIFVASRDLIEYGGTTNRIWEAFQDRTDTGNPISWQAETKQWIFPTGKGKIRYAESAWAQMSGPVRIRVYWRGTRGIYKLFSTQTFNASQGPFNTIMTPTFGEFTEIQGTRKQTRFYHMTQVDDTAPSKVSGFVEKDENDNEDRAFSLLFVVEGQAALVGYRLWIDPILDEPHGLPNESEPWPLPERFVLDNGQSVADLAELPAYITKEACGGTEGLDQELFKSCQSYTATCADGGEGEPVTKTARAYSATSQADADAKALAAAQAEAEAELVCLWTATESYTAECPEGETGDPVTKTVTATSNISLADAEEKALFAAQEEAEAALVCTPDPVECCMYSAAALANGDYTTEDLPEELYVETDEVTGTFTKDEEEQSFSNVGNTYTILLDDGVWKLQENAGPSFVLTIGDCLITEQIQDTFPDTLEFTWPLNGDLITLTRTSDTSCNWSYSGECNPTTPVAAASIIWDPSDSKWKMTVTYWEIDGDENCYTTGYLDNAEKDSGTQSSPAGTYGGIIVS